MTTDAETLPQLLRMTRFADGLTDRELALAASAARLLTCHAGDVLFCEGTEEDEIFVIVSGRVAIEMQVPRRGAVRLLTAGPGDLVGWSGLLGEGRMTATAVITEETRLIALSSRALRQLCEQDDRLGHMLMKQTARAVSQRLLATRLQLLDLFSETEPGFSSAQGSASGPVT